MELVVVDLASRTMTKKDAWILDGKAITSNLFTAGANLTHPPVFSDPPLWLWLGVKTARAAPGWRIGACFVQRRRARPPPVQHIRVPRADPGVMTLR